MSNIELLSQIKQAADQASLKAEEYSGVVSSIKAFIVEHFGQNGLIATYAVLFIVAVLLLSKVAKLTFSTLKYLVVPALALAFLATLFLHCSFLVALPVTVTFCSLFLLFRG